MDNDSIKKNIEKIRLEHNLSQIQMADAIGVVRNTYRNIEKGKTRMISDNVMKVAKWAGITPEEVLLGFIPSETDNETLKEANERFNLRVKEIIEEYDIRMNTLREENGLLRDLVKEKEEYIRALKSMIALLQNKPEEEKNA